jgi:hypothetical protein
MSYHKEVEIPKSTRAKGRKYQQVGGKQVRKYAFSPYTAKPYINYGWYADVEALIQTRSDPKDPTAWVVRTTMTSVAYGTYLEFRDAVRSGEINEKIQALMGLKHAEIRSISYWRGRDKGND